MIRPYGERNAHLGTSSTSLPSPTSFNFDFDNCKVAQYLIKRDGEIKLKNRNGTPTELAIHAKECQECRPAAEISKPQEIHKYKTRMIECDEDIAKKLEMWSKKNAESQRLDQAILLLIAYFEFARKELKGKL